MKYNSMMNDPNHLLVSRVAPIVSSGAGVRDWDNRGYSVLGIVIAVCCFVAAMADIAGAQTPTWQRDSYQAAYAMERPWEAAGLTPVVLTKKLGQSPIVLAEKGQAALPIVVPAGDPYYAEVAATLKKFLDEASGADFAILEDRKNPNLAIFVGPCVNSRVQRVTNRVAELPPEHFIVDCFDGGIILSGRDLDFLYEKPRGRMTRGDTKQSRGTYFAVLDFLERFIGVRFFKPGRLGTVVPYLNDRKLVFPAVSYHDGPVFKSRDSSYGTYLTKDHKLLGYTKKTGILWMNRLRRGDVHRLKWGHTDTYWHEVYAESNPEFFALREDGSRMIGKGSVHSSQRCYSDEAGFQEHLRIIDRYYQTGEGAKLLRSPPNRKYIYWWPNDGFRGCACSQCMKLTDPEAPSDRVHSRLIWAYVDKLARAIKQRWPDKVLAAPLYATWYHVPDDFRMPDNVRLIATWNHVSEGLLKEPRYWDFVTNSIQQQSRFSCEPIVIWSHYPHKPRIKNRLDTPYPAPHVLKRLLVNHRDTIGGVYLNGYACTSFALDGFILYVYKKMLWNPDLDVDACLDDYCHALFGPASAEVKTYLNQVVQRWETTRWSELPEGYDSVDGRIRWQSFYQETYPRDVRIALKNALARAVAKTKPGTVYHARASYFAEATEPFFAQGEFYDRGKMAIVEAARFKPEFDGKLDEWNNIPSVSLKNNSDGEAATVRTDVFFAYGPKALYVAGRAEEPETLQTFKLGLPRDFRLRRRDSIELFLCTPQPGVKEAGLGITEQYHQIIIDPNGAIADGYKSVQANAVDPSVTIELACKTNRYPRGFTFEIAIPYRSLHTAVPQPGDHWVANVYRNRAREGEPQDKRVSSWAPTMGSYHRTSRFGRIEFPTQTHWQAELGDFKKSWRVMSNVSGSSADFVSDQHLKVTPSLKDGRLRLHVQADGQLPKNAELKFLSRKAEADFSEPVLLDWKFRFQGNGLKRVRHYIVDRETKSQLTSSLALAKSSTNSGWINQQAREPTKGELSGMYYYAFGLSVEPGADFVFEVDRIRVMGRR